MPADARFAALLMVCLVAPLAASAQTSSPNMAPAYAAMTKACTSDVLRFCPDVSSVQERNIAICLRPYRNNLTLGCRSALRKTRAGRTSGPAAAL